MDEKSGAPEATSDNIQNEEKPESLECVNQEANLNLVGDSKNIDIPIAQSDDNINKITCGNTVDNNLHLKHNEVIHNSNHTLEFEKEPKDVTHDGDKHDQNAEVNEGIITCDGNVSDLDANDNNTSAGEPINANESPCLKDVGGGGQENSKDNMGVFNDICDKLETNVPMEIGESSTDIINNIQNKPDTEILCNFEKATGNASSIDIADCVKENVSKDIAQDTTKVIEKASSNNDTDMISDIQNQDVGVEIDTKHVEVNNSTEIVEEKGMQTIEVAQEKSMEIAEGKKTEEQSLEIVENEKTEEKITETEEEKSVDIAENNSTEKVKSSTVGEEEKLQVEKDTSLENEIESKNETSEMEIENMSIDKIAEKDVVDAEDKNDDCDVSPDFECSDIKEHVPSDDKIDSNDKASNEEAAVTEEDPFDQVVNEAMDIDESQTKESPMSKGLDSFECREVNISQSKDLEKTYDKMEQDNSVEELSEKGMNDDSAIEEAEEIQDFEASKGADEEICLLPDTEREISEADKERAILAKEILAKEAANKEAQEASSAFDTLFDGENEKSTSPRKDTDGISTVDKISSENISQDIEAKDETHSDDISLKESDDKDTESIDNTETELDIQEPLKENIIQEMPSLLQTCTLCSKEKQCNFQMLVEGIVKYLCQKDCVLNYKTENEQYTINMKKVIIKEIIGCEKTCEQCCNVKTCQYEIVKESTFLCNDDCVKEYKLQTFAKFIFKYKKVIIQEIMPSEHTCSVCNICKDVSYQYNVNNEDKYICSETCLTKLQEEFPDKYCVKVRKLFRVKEMPRLLNATTKIATESPKIIARTEEAAELAKLDREKSFTRNCRMCNEIVNGDEKNLTWETMDFCNEDCLSKYQNVTHSNCTNCKTRVQTASLGKYCVRFGFDVRQFCSSGCLEEFKKGLKVCSYCQKDISGGFEGFLAPVGDKGQFKDFCSQACMEKFDQMSKNAPAPNVVSQCAVCSKDKIVKVDVVIDGNDHKMCSTPCFSAFKFVNKVFPDQCDMCKKYYERKSSEHYTIYDESGPSMFCSKTCMNVFILSNRQIVPCSWCKVKKYNFDMIQRNFKGGQTVMMCSINCLTLYQVSVNAVSMRRIKCDHCKSLSQAQYHLTMSDATIRNFCTYQCVMAFQGQYAKSPITLGAEHKAQSATALKGAPVPTGVPKRTYNATRQAKAGGKSSVANKSFDTPIISNVQSLAPPINVHHTRGSTKTNQKTHQSASQTAPSTTAPPPPLPPKPQFTTQLIVKPPCPKLVANMSTMCKPITMSKSTSCRQQMAAKECQTDDSLQKRILIPIPVPIYVPTPLNMYSLPYPVPVPIPLPIPVPVFIPTTRNSANGIMKEIKKIHEKMPTDPFEAELLMMAEMVAGDKKRNESDSESEEEPADDDGFSPEGMETSNTFGEDMLQMALKMATEYDEPAVDLESAMTANTITPSSHPPMTNEEGVDDPNPMHHHHMLMMEQQRAALRGRKRPNRPQNNSLGGGANKRNRRVSNTDGLPMMQPPAQPEPPREPTEKPDANMCLKYTFGVNAWKQWVMTKNADLEKSSIRRKPFKSEILQLTADELNYSLCLFVKEVRKPNGSEYAPDTIYYLVLGIQQYLFENGRIDNIFTDAYYEKFTECLDEVAKKFSVLYNDSQYIVTRVEEEHLWESKQLGAHSPHVLLSTLMFFNTKHFNLVTVEEHMQLSFSHIMKHWKRNPNQPGATKVPGSRNVLLRFYPPQAALEANSRKKKVYEQQENEENPLRCPVKLYEFYLSKCPESVKTRNDVFYLLPERSCVPDSPVWYSTMALGKEPLQKMLHRVKMVKEINIALLTS